MTEISDIHVFTPNGPRTHHNTWLIGWLVGWVIKSKSYITMIRIQG